MTHATTASPALKAGFIDRLRLFFVAGRNRGLRPRMSARAPALSKHLLKDVGLAPHPDAAARQIPTGQDAALRLERMALGDRPR